MQFFKLQKPDTAEFAIIGIGQQIIERLDFWTDTLMA